MKSNGKMAQLTATPRTEKKGAALRLLRQGGRVPAVVYGPGLEGAAIHVDEKEVLKVARTGRSEMFNLNFEGGKTVPVLIKDQQERNGRLLHVDFLQISKNKPISVSVSIDFQGTAAGSKAGGVFQTQETQLEVEGLPADLPTSIEVDVSGLEIGDRLTAGDIKLEKGLTLVTSGDSIIASVMPPQAAEEEPTASADEAAPAAPEEPAKEE